MPEQGNWTMRFILLPLTLPVKCLFYVAAFVWTQAVSAWQLGKRHA